MKFIFVYILQFQIAILISTWFPQTSAQSSMSLREARRKFDARCRQLWGGDENACMRHMSRFCRRRGTSPDCIAYKVIQEYGAAQSEPEPEPEPQNDNSRGGRGRGGRNGGAGGRGGNRGGGRGGGSGRGEGGRGGGGWRNSNVTIEERIKRRCNGLQAEELEFCKRRIQCKSKENRDERRRCVKELRCGHLRGTEHDACMNQKLCMDYEKEEDQIKCRIDQRCTGLAGSKYNECVKFVSLNCKGKKNPDERQKCRAERLCGHINDIEEKEDCKKEVTARCHDMPEGDAKEACFEQRRARRADRRKLAGLQNRLKFRAQRFKTQSDQTYNSLNRQKITRDRNSQRQHCEMTVNEMEHTEYFAGDIELTNRQADEIIQELDSIASRGKRKKRKVGTTPAYRLWTNMPISYHFAGSVPASTQNVIRQAIQKWQQHTCIRFQENGPKSDRIEFYNGDGCASYVGRTGGVQQISVKTPGCAHIGIVMHEIGHALGFLHEQARPDQSRNVYVMYDNIFPARWNNFLPAVSNDVTYANYPYDMGSVMHYDAYAFALNPNKPVIETVDQSYQDTIGQRAEPSFIDYAQVNNVYCAKSCPRPPSCQHGGYADPNDCSKCKCPSGYGGRLCEQRESAGCGFEQQIGSSAITINSNGQAHCVWRLTTTQGNKITVQFEPNNFKFTCKDSCDVSHVELKNGDDWRKTGYRFCCKPPQQPVVSSGNEMIVIVRNQPGRQANFQARVSSDSTANVPGPTPRSLPTPAATHKPTIRPPVQPTPAPFIPTQQPTQPPPPVFPTGPVPGGQGCQCGQWTGFNACSQPCGGCGTITRTRICTGTAQECFRKEERKCNFQACSGNSIRFGNGKVHFLTDGCCLGLWNTEGTCGGINNIAQIPKIAEKFLNLIPGVGSGSNSGGGSGGGSGLTGILGGSGGASSGARAASGGSSQPFWMRALGSLLGG